MPPEQQTEKINCTVTEQNSEKQGCGEKKRVKEVDRRISQTKVQQEDLTEEKEKLLQAKEAMEKANEDRFVSFNEYKESIGWKDEAADPEAEKLRNAVWDAVSAYNNYSDKKERKLLVSMLMPGESDKANNA